MPPKESKALTDALARLLRRPSCASGWGGRARAGEQFAWENITAKVEDYYGFVLRRLAAHGGLPEGFHAEIPQSPRAQAQPVSEQAGECGPGLVRRGGLGGGPRCAARRSRRRSASATRPRTMRCTRRPRPWKRQEHDRRPSANSDGPPWQPGCSR